MSQLTEGKCLRCASFLSRPQNTCHGRQEREIPQVCAKGNEGVRLSARFRRQGSNRVSEQQASPPPAAAPQTTNRTRPFPPPLPAQSTAWRW